VLVWGLLVSVVVAYAIGIDRTFLIDQPNYVQYFYSATTLEWLKALTPGESSLQSVIVYLVSGEVLWQVWATALGWIFAPPTAVVVTVCALNLLLAFAVKQLPDPVLPLIIWILLPVGFAVTGLLQLRQGFALAVMLYITLRLDRPVLGTLIATMIHTTFAVALPFAVIAWLCGRRRLLALLLIIFLACGVAYLGGALFEAFGGRRLQVYDVNETDATSILYVFGAILCGLPSLHRLFKADVPGETAVASRTLASVALMHLGVIAFSAASFFVFPLGAGRAGYLITLLLIPILPTMRWRGTLAGTIIFSLMVLYLVYLAVKTCLEGTYDIYFAG